MKPRPSDRKHSSVASAAAGRVRIIGGHWRGTKLDVPDRPGLRPTSDRVRETLFNWLQPHLSGATCLDLFAGSGALGFEAASRGAAACVLIERDAELAQRLHAHAARLQATQVEVHAMDAVTWLSAPATVRFDIVFVDPPFEAQLHAAVVARLDDWLAPQAMIYVEAPRDAVFAPPAHWALHREGSTREVRYALYRRLDRAAA